MIVSHKHKFIFVKTHKTATQTFLKFIKPHLGPDDVMAGDPPNDQNADTRVNIEKPFPETGKTALEYQEVYGNHLPWFMIKEITGDEIWNNYTKFTIERNPYDRFLSLFYFLNPVLTRNKLILNPSLVESLTAIQKTLPGNSEVFPLKEKVEWARDNTFMSFNIEALREYFEEWLLVQLESPVMKLDDNFAYGTDCVSHETKIYKDQAKKMKFHRLTELFNANTLWESNQPFIKFPYANTTDYGIAQPYFKKLNNIRGQVRFLNYGNYFDGKELKVDHIVDFANVGNNIGKFFKKFNININCNKNLYDAASQNAHYRKNLEGKKTTDWWYQGPKGAWLDKVIKRRFFNNNMNENQINFDKIVSK